MMSELASQVPLKDSSSSSSARVLKGPDPEAESVALYTNTTISNIEKLESLVPYVQRWLNSEATNPFKVSATDPTQPEYEVDSHNTFGRMQAALYKNCSCTTEECASQEPRPHCFWHCEQPCINDVVYEVTLVVHEMFGDEFTCFANLVAEMYGQGSLAVVAVV